MTDIIQLRGNCQLCGRLQAASFGSVAKHGYTVDHGYFNGVCNGHNHAPIQKDRTYLDRVVASISRDIDDLLAKIAGLKSGKVKPIYAQGDKRVPGEKGRGLVWEQVLFAQASEYNQSNAVQSAIYAAEGRIRAGQAHINMLLKLASEVHGKPLVEVVKPAPTERIQHGEFRRKGDVVYTVTSLEGARVYYSCTRDGGEKVFKGWMGTQAFRKLDLIAKV